MNGETVFLHSLGVWSVPVCRSVEDPRGARHWGRIWRRTLVFGRSVWILTMMQSCASAAKLRAAGPILSVGIKCQVRIRFPATSDRQFGSRLKASAQRRKMVLSGMLVPVSLFQDAGRKTTPSSGSPVVTKRQSAMISLRASPTIIVLRVPLRLSAVRARYQCASALSF
jgi:hypothetical protein